MDNILLLGGVNDCSVFLAPGVKVDALHLHYSKQPGSICFYFDLKKHVGYAFFIKKTDELKIIDLLIQIKKSEIRKSNFSSALEPRDFININTVFNGKCYILSFGMSKYVKW